ncbi:hypothetical protein MNBD_GAMMA07-2108 [hydrothermal vent metagenome]|uniref:Uncharacterized protein n=1 Tax=hydrothermal vent metagenome TaxID=652676 RepID=A0A3B0WTT8_9ZZZZ
MCSSPKGGSTKPLLSASVDSMSGGMSSSEYSDMVLRANESYERRQEELIEYRKTHIKKLSISQKKQSEISFFEKIKVLFGQMIRNESLESKKRDFF